MMQEEAIMAYLSRHFPGQTGKQQKTVTMAGLRADDLNPGPPR
jgi:hypothetical protein